MGSISDQAQNKPRGAASMLSSTLGSDFGFPLRAPRETIVSYTSATMVEEWR